MLFRSIKYPVSQIDAFVQSKELWIRTKREKIARQIEKQNLEMPTFEPGSFLNVLGHAYEVKVQNTSVDAKHLRHEGVYLVDGNAIIVTKHKTVTHMIKLVEDFYRKEAQKFIDVRTRTLSAKLGVTPTKVVAKTQKKRWGTCTSQGHIYLNWKLMMVPAEVFEYVMIHEWCHLHHLDHSKAFWHVVKQADPRHKAHISWLKENSFVIRWPYQS